MMGARRAIGSKPHTGEDVTVSLVTLASNEIRLLFLKNSGVSYFFTYFVNTPKISENGGRSLDL